MLKTLAHTIAARPAVYNLIQELAGVRHIRRRLAARLAPWAACDPVVLDLGGGTGTWRTVLPPAARYVCLDIDPVKLGAFRQANPAQRALLCDAAALAVASDSVDLVLCIDVTHHLEPACLAGVFAESARILRQGGRLLLVDAVWQPARRFARLLWRYDRGAYPHKADLLHETVARDFAILDWQSFAVFHEYVICEAVKRG